MRFVTNCDFLNLTILGILGVFISLPDDASATSQWSRKTGIECSGCHTVFPRLNTTGEDFLKGGYQLEKAHEGFTLDKVENLFGFRLNMTPIQLETNTLKEDSTTEPKTRITLGNPVWLQMFVAGSIYKDISFFSELEYSSGSFKFNWFYFNFTNLANSPYLNFQVGNISPLEFASYPNRLPQLPNLKSEVMLIKSSGGQGEESVDMSSARPGIQYFGYNEWGLLYLGTTPGTKAVDVNQFLHFWGGLVFRLPANTINGLEGSTATIHYYGGTDTKGTGTAPGPQLENKFTRLSPQVNIRYKEKVDIQAAYVIAKDENVALVDGPTEDYKYSGIGIEGGYMPNVKWHLGLHFDSYKSDDEIPSGNPGEGEPVVKFSRIVPAATYIINQNIRFTLYYEKDLLKDRGPGGAFIGDDEKAVDKIYINMRTMF
jgi:hypothetical protein